MPRPRRGRGRNGLTVPAMPTQALGRMAGTMVQNGACTVVATERWNAFFAAAGTVYNAVFLPGRSGLVRLDGIAALYEQWRVHSVELHYRAYTGTTQSGAVNVGVDYDARTAEPTLADIQALNPNVEGPVWQSAAIPVDVNRVMKGRWHYTAQCADNHPDLGPGFAVVAHSSLANAGAIWVTYRVEFTGPTAGCGATPPPVVNSGVVADWQVGAAWTVTAEGGTLSGSPTTIRGVGSYNPTDVSGAQPSALSRSTVVGPPQAWAPAAANIGGQAQLHWSATAAIPVGMRVGDYLVVIVGAGKHPRSTGAANLSAYQGSTKLVTATWLAANESAGLVVRVGDAARWPFDAIEVEDPGGSSAGWAGGTLGLTYQFLLVRPAAGRLGRLRLAPAATEARSESSDYEVLDRAGALRDAFAQVLRLVDE